MRKSPPVITRIAKGRVEHRVKPQGVGPEGGDVVEFGNDARQVADAVPVGIEEGLRVNLIENGGFEPL